MLERTSFSEKVLWAAFRFQLGYILLPIIRTGIIYYMMTRKKSVVLEAGTAFLNMRVLCNAEVLELSTCFTLDVFPLICGNKGAS